jgi:hydroxymethylbilane synthase
MRIGTRGSALALWQANHVAGLIREAGGPACEIVVIRTSGDERAGPPDAPLALATDADHSGAAVNVKRMFVKELEEALLDARIDLAVHSSKDLPAALPGGLTIAAALAREDPRDAMVSPSSRCVDGFEALMRALPPRPRIGTSSVRRTAQLHAVFPGATFVAIRGNVDTRLRKLDAGECDAIVLAAAGLRRLGLTTRVSALVPIEVCMPAPGQGIIAVEMRSGASAATRDLVRCISDADAETALLCERAVVQALGAGCQTPLGVLAHTDEQQLTVHGVVASPDGRTIVRGVMHGNRGGATAAGEKLAAALLAKGAGDLLK